MFFNYTPRLSQPPIFVNWFFCRIFPQAPAKSKTWTGFDGYGRR